MTARLSPLRAFHTTRSVLSIRTISTKPGLKAPRASSSSTLLSDFASNSNATGTAAASDETASRYGELTDRLLKQGRKRVVRRRDDHAEDIRIGQENARLLEISRSSRRNWQAGDVYAPHDLSSGEARKWKRRQTPSSDVFDQLAINPLDEWKNVAMMGEFVTSMGRIKARRDTGLRPVNQRKIAKAIRRGIGMGFLPSVHAHPEILRRGERAGYLR